MELLVIAYSALEIPCFSWFFREVFEKAFHNFCQVKIKLSLVRVKMGKNGILASFYELQAQM